MKIISESNLYGFKAWSGAVDTKNTIIEAGKEYEFEALIDELYPDGLSDTQLNDILWFESEWLFDTLEIEAE